MLLQLVNNLSSVGGSAGEGGALGISHLSVSFFLLSTLVGIDQSSSCLSGCVLPVLLDALLLHYHWRILILILHLVYLFVFLKPFSSSSTSTSSSTSSSVEGVTISRGVKSIIPLSPCRYIIKVFGSLDELY